MFDETWTLANCACSRRTLEILKKDMPRPVAQVHDPTFAPPILIKCPLLMVGYPIGLPWNSTRARSLLYISVAVLAANLVGNFRSLKKIDFQKFANDSVSNNMYKSYIIIKVTDF